MIIKKYQFFAFLSILSLSFVLGAQAETIKAPTKERIGFVNVEEVVAKSEHAKQYFEKFKTSDAKEGQLLHKMQGELESKNKELQKEVPTLSPEVARSRQKELNELYTTFRKKVSEFDKTRSKRRQDYLTKMKPLIQKAIESEVLLGKYTLILDVKATVFYDEKRDITDGVLKAVDKESLK